MKRLLVLLVVAGVLAVGPALAGGDGGQCSCSADHWLSSGCSITGPCPCNCSCGLFRCGCYCASRQFDTPMVG